MTIGQRLAVACVRNWTRLYTAGLPPAVRGRRRAEVDSDLWESLTDDISARLLIVRVLLGMPDDVGWRVEHAFLVGTRGLTLAGYVLGAAFVVCAAGVIQVDATRTPPPRHASSNAVRHREVAWRCGATVSADRRHHPDECSSPVTHWRDVASASNPRITEAVNAPAQAPLTFEAASVRPNTSGLPYGDDKVLPGGRYTSTNLSLLVLIRFAYDPSPRSRGLAPFEVEGGPSWIANDRFDVNATAGQETSLSELRTMLRALLAERFHVQAHVETRQIPVYRMMTTKTGKLGPQLRRTSAECGRAPLDPLRGITPGENAPCGYFGPSPDVAMGTGRAYQAFRGMTMEDLALRLHEFLHRRVIDNTNLPGYFDGDFEFTSEIMLPPPPPGRPNPYEGRVFPSIFSVLPQQLGLKLDSQRGPADILVIDRAERPTPD